MKLFLVTSNEFEPSNGFEGPRFSSVLGVFTAEELASERIRVEIQKRITPSSFVHRHFDDVVLLDEEPTPEQIEEDDFSEIDRVEFEIQTIETDTYTDITVFNH